MNAGAKGVKIMCSGRLAGAEIARRETQKKGSIPLHTLDADVDYATARAETTYGTIGIKVWVHKGAFGEVLTGGADASPSSVPRFGNGRRRGFR